MVLESEDASGARLRAGPGPPLPAALASARIATRGEGVYSLTYPNGDRFPLLNFSFVLRTAINDVRKVAFARRRDALS